MQDILNKKKKEEDKLIKATLTNKKTIEIYHRLLVQI